MVVQKNKDFEEAIRSFSEEIKDLVRQTKSLIHKIFPEVMEVVWIKQKNIGFGTGPKKETEHFCCLMPATHHDTVGFNYGAELPDPKKILEGTGKLFRHYKIKSIEDLSNPDLIQLIKFSATYRVPPFSQERM